jgi:hypothetical protein
VTLPTVCRILDRAISHTFQSAYPYCVICSAKKLDQANQSSETISTLDSDQTAGAASASSISLYRFRMVTSEMFATSLTWFWVTFWLHNSEAA